MSAYNVEHLKSLPTLSTAQADSLKLEIPGVQRVWICRCGTADGMCCDNHVTVEECQDGRWVTVFEECNP